MAPISGSAQGGSMQGKTCVITGATSGIGREAARQLAALGAGLVIVGRDQRRGEAALRWLAERVPGVTASLRIADLSRLAELRRLAADLAATVPRIDVLINNAGAFFDRHEMTADGLERTFALNHMAYFVLSNLLLEKLKEAAPARIVSVASGAHRGGTIDFGDLEGRGQAAKGWPAYRSSKLANILFTAELARRLEGSGVTANCLHPGFVASRFGDETGPLVRIALGIAKRFAAISVEDGAKTVTYLASSPEVATVSGRYFANCREDRPSEAARDAAAAGRLWDESARIARIGP
jgi:NAD(P)-dependent dehydrogenase (short-subunit alcohol dehydrogenase family)